MSELNEYGMKPEGADRHGYYCDCSACDDMYESDEYAFGEDDF